MHASCELRPALLAPSEVSSFESKWSTGLIRSELLTRLMIYGAQNRGNENGVYMNS